MKLPPALVLLLTLSLPLASATGQTPQSENSSSPRGIALPNHHPQWASPANDLGAVAPDHPMSALTIVLAPSPAQSAAFQSFLAAQQDPSSPNYHRWLTPAQVGDHFGPSAQSVSAIKEWLESHNLHVDWISPSRTFVGFSGAAGDIGSAFQTEVHTYRVDGVHRFAVASDPIIPAAFSASIASIRGLYQAGEHPLAHARPLTSASPEFTNGASHFIAPADFAAIYGIGSGLTATGQTIGIVGESRTYSGDFSAFDGITGSSLAQPTEIIPTAFGGADPGLPLTAPPAGNVSIDAQLEATLDVQRASSTAPDAGLLLVVATSASGGIGADAQYLVQTTPVPAQVMSISFGECESAGGSAEVNFWDTLFKQAASEGISVFVSSGDAGASGCDTNFATPPANPRPISPNVICSSSYATCVGGTEFNDASNPARYWAATNGNYIESALGYIPEGAWNEPFNDSSKTQAASSGGGVSSIIPTPPWQTGSGVPAARSGRYTPDVAFSATSHDGYLGCFAAGGGSCMSTGNGTPFVSFYGTSAAAPAMAGITALLNYQAGSSQGNINPALYKLAAGTPSAFHDATVSSSGVSACSLNTPSLCNNSIPSSTGLSGSQPGYLLTAGYDQVTGLGSLNVEPFINAFIGPKGTPAISIADTASITTAQDDLISIVLTGRGSIVPTGSVVLTCGSFTSAPGTVTKWAGVL